MCDARKDFGYRLVWWLGIPNRAPASAHQLSRRVGMHAPTLGRTMDVQFREVDLMNTASRRRDRRMDLRTTSEERELIDRAVAATGTDLTDFVVSHAYDAALRVLADRDRFELDAPALEAWEAINVRPARELPGLRELMQRPSPFSE